MTAIEKEILQGGLCANCECSGFNAKLNYELDLSTKKIKVTDASEFDSTDALKIVLVHVHDKEGETLHDKIETQGGNVEIDVSALNLKDLSLLVTVVSTNGCKADLSIYNLGNTALNGEFENKADQGNRNNI